MNWLYAIAASLVVGFCTGYYTKTQFDKADHVDEMVEVRKEDASNVANIQAKDGALGVRLDQNTATHGAIAHATPVYLLPASSRNRACPNSVTAGFPNQSAPTPVQLDGPQTVASDDVLPVGTVRLLDAARRGALDPVSLPSDEEGRAASDITFGVFEENDREIAKLYHDLAERHNALVEAAEKVQADQRKRMGLR